MKTVLHNVHEEIAYGGLLMAGGVVEGGGGVEGHCRFEGSYPLPNYRPCVSVLSGLSFL